MTRARKILKQKIIKKSKNQNFETAKKEWRAIHYYQDDTKTSMCECNKKDIKRLWEIVNI